MSSVWVTLEHYEFSMGVYVGSRRQLGNVIAKRKPRNGMPEDEGWNNHIEGTCGEIAAAKFLNLYWSGTQETFGKETDLRPMIEVKTGSKHSHRLLIRKHEDLDQVFIWVTGTAPTFQIHGWCLGRDVAIDEHLDSPSGRPEAWFIPPKLLSADWTELKKTYLRREDRE